MEQMYKKGYNVIVEGYIMKIRVCKLHIENFKNIRNGAIVFPMGKKARTLYPDGAEILGIYGQNGSGKSAVVEVLALLQRLLSGKGLPKDINEMLTDKEDRASLKCNFYINNYGLESFLIYEAVFRKNDKQEVEIFSEKVKTSQKSDEKWSAIRTSLEYRVDRGYTPEKLFEQARKGKEYEKLIEMRVLSMSERKSYLFNDYMVRYITPLSACLATLLDNLIWYAKFNMMIIENDFTGDINNKSDMPFYAHINGEENYILYGVGKLPMCGSSVIEKKMFHYFSCIINQINIVLKNIIPGLEIGLKDYGPQMLDNGEDGVRVELFSSHEGSHIPFHMESDGIKKITSILSALIAMYNDECVFLVIDEFDAGIYEYLLGQIIEVLQENGKGQLLFTSHNLILLEKLTKDSIYFTTTDPMDRFMQFQYVKSNNNLRDLYLRTIELGGQNKEIYEATSAARMNHAFRKAGDFVYSREKN